LNMEFENKMKNKKVIVKRKVLTANHQYIYI
jgi:hypothetical protein